MGTSSRLPSRQQVTQVYAIIVLLLYGWTMLWFLWKLPSWLGFLTVGEILTVLAYSLSTNFVESLAALCVPVAFALILPRAWFRDAFVARGATMMIASLGALMLAAGNFRNRDELPYLLVGAWRPALVLLGIAAAAFLAGHVGKLRGLVEALADRATIFLYAALPLSILSILVIAARWAL